MLNTTLFKNKKEIDFTINKYDCIDDFIEENIFRFKEIISCINHELIHRKIYGLFKINSEEHIDIYLETNDKRFELSHFPYLIPEEKIRKLGFLRHCLIEFLHFIYDVSCDMFSFGLISLLYRIPFSIRNVLGKNSEIYSPSTKNSKIELIYRINF